MERSLRDTVRQVLLSDVIRMEGSANGARGGGSEAWRVMVLDARATRVISSVVGMYDIMEGQVTVVEDLHKVRKYAYLWRSVIEKLSCIHSSLTFRLSSNSHCYCCTRRELHMYL